MTAINQPSNYTQAERRLVLRTIREGTTREPLLVMSRDLLAARTGLARDRAAYIADSLARYGYAERMRLSDGRVYYVVSELDEPREAREAREARHHAQAVRAADRAAQETAEQAITARARDLARARQAGFDTTGWPAPEADDADDADEPDEPSECAICPPGQCPGPECPGSLRAADPEPAPGCPVCGGEGIPLGTLGRLGWFRCRACGSEYHTGGAE